jgi:hypothetical protein
VNFTINDEKEKISSDLTKKIFEISRITRYNRLTDLIRRHMSVVEKHEPAAAPPGSQAEGNAANGQKL